MQFYLDVKYKNGKSSTGGLFHKNLKPFMLNCVCLDETISRKTFYRHSSAMSKHVNLDNPVLQDSQH